MIDYNKKSNKSRNGKIPVPPHIITILPLFGKYSDGPKGPVI